MTNPSIECLKSEFKEFCSALYINQIDTLFALGGLQSLQKKSETRRGEVEEYYKLLNWEKPEDQAKFLKVIEKTLLDSSFSSESKEEVQNICTKCGFEIDDDGHTVYMPKDTHNNIKNIIFASNGPKPIIVFNDSLNNDIDIVKNKQYCLIYNYPIKKHGLRWIELVNWWKDITNNQGLSDSDAHDRLYKRLNESMQQSEPEKILFETYYTKLYPKLLEQLPALIPQVYLHYDPYTIRQLRIMSKDKNLERQRMDFLMLLPKARIVIEIDGKQHYSDDKKMASPSKYAEMVVEDRKLKLLGYEVYRFGGYEFCQPNIKTDIERFFLYLLNKYNISNEF